MYLYVPNVHSVLALSSVLLSFQIQVCNGLIREKKGIHKDIIIPTSDVI